MGISTRETSFGTCGAMEYRKEWVSSFLSILFKRLQLLFDDQPGIDGMGQGRQMVAVLLNNQAIQPVFGRFDDRMAVDKLYFICIGFGYYFLYYSIILPDAFL